MILSILLVICAAIFKAAADRIANHNYTVSIFKGWWLTQGRFLPLTKYKIDGWHISNSGMICSFIALIFCTVDWYFYFILGTVFILVFNLFYNHIFKA